MLTILKICASLLLVVYFYQVLFPSSNEAILSILFGIGLGSLPFFIIEFISDKHKSKEF